ncbi:hypothetical protein B0T16DRAFT_151076 [Cercophora newfieldiana]|uniref:DUF5672 domain-containing protein n=1 Tax=Cercophora newfieldiana TaxID=92897 RepID=A0AA40CR03_9PEZI|nr:hypothetical protein B0T16DRAFT_151076 [Cercophora newfieldiana]
MSATLGSRTPSVFALSRGKVLLVVSLAITWWFASILPLYKPVIKEKFKARLDDALQALPSVNIDWSRPSHDLRDAYNSSKVALMIEPRPLPHLVPHLLHMISVVPPDWRFLFIGSQESVVSVGRAYATQYQQVVGKLDLMVLPEPWEISSKEHVFRTLTDPRFYNEFLPDVEWILKYESDAILCANAETSLNEWLDWSWVGAPRAAAFNGQAQGNPPGNGGLSLRRVSAIRRVLSFQARYNDSEPEDEWFFKRIYLLPDVKVASPTEQALSVEDVYFPNAMGYHVRDGGRSSLPYQVWGDEGQRKEIFNYCPELSMIMEMKLERERCNQYSPQANPAYWGGDEARKTFLDHIKQQQNGSEVVQQEAVELDREGSQGATNQENEIPESSFDGSEHGAPIDPPDEPAIGSLISPQDNSTDASADSLDEASELPYVRASR